MSNNSRHVIFGVWQPWQVAVALTAALDMERRGMTPGEYADAARRWLRDNVAGQVPVAAPGADPPRWPHSGRPGRLQRPAVEAERGLMRDGVCPRCGAVLEIKRMCPRVSSRIRTQMCCTRDDCNWMAVSEHGWDYLKRRGLDGNVEVQ